MNLKGSDHTRWLIPIILGTWEAEIGRINDEANPGKKLMRSCLNRQARCGGTCP
jgi:hypothetical protein